MRNFIRTTKNKIRKQLIILVAMLLVFGSAPLEPILFAVATEGAVEEYSEPEMAPSELFLAEEPSNPSLWFL